jgi:hypothetical protein
VEEKRERTGRFAVPTGESNGRRAVEESVEEITRLLRLSDRAKV